MRKTQVVLVTGASSGIGNAVAKKLAGSGHIVYAAARRRERLAPLEALGVHILKMDLTLESDVVACVDSLLAAEGRLDVLINAAGYGSFGAVEDVPPTEARRQFDVNVFGTARLIQRALPPMRARRSGTIITVSAVAGKIAHPMAGWYIASKHALEGLHDALRAEVRGFGIDVVLVEPAAIRTEFAGIAARHLFDASADGAYQDAARKIGNSLNGGEGTPPEAVAQLIGKILDLPHPKPRYAAGNGAGLLLFLRRCLPDRAFESVLGFILKMKAQRKGRGR